MGVFTTKLAIRSERETDDEVAGHLVFQQKLC